MLNELKQMVFLANVQLVEKGLVMGTWGNASGLSRSAGLMVIKPSGVQYEKMKSSDMVVVRLSDGAVVEGDLKPSSDTPTHLELYRKFNDIGGIVHTHSSWATIFAQSMHEIPALGTTHADHFYGNIPCTRCLTDSEIKGSYEQETGKVIVEAFHDRNPMEIPGVLVANHGPFTWGKNPSHAVQNAAVMEEIALMAWHSLLMSPKQPGISKVLLDRHYLRKHGVDATYGQR